MSNKRFPCLCFWFSAAAASGSESEAAVEIDVDFETLISTNRNYQKFLQSCLYRIEMALTENRERQSSLATDIKSALTRKVCRWGSPNSEWFLTQNASAHNDFI